MPMVPGDASCTTGLSAETWALMLATFGAQLPNESADNYAIRVTKLKQLANVLATAHVGHIQVNATVSTNVAVASVSGVTTGPSASGPGTGTGTGTVA